MISNTFFNHSKELTTADPHKEGSLSVECMLKFEEQEHVPAGCIPWCPPMPTWNPWTGSNIDEGPYLNATLNDINNDVMGQEQIRQVDPNLQESVEFLSIWNLILFALSGKCE